MVSTFTPSAPRAPPAPFLVRAVALELESPWGTPFEPPPSALADPPPCPQMMSPTSRAHTAPACWSPEVTLVQRRNRLLKSWKLSLKSDPPLPSFRVSTKSVVLSLAAPITRACPLNVTVNAGGAAACAHAEAADPRITAPTARSNPTRFIPAPPVAGLMGRLRRVVRLRVN